MPTNVCNGPHNPRSLILNAAECRNRLRRFLVWGLLVFASLAVGWLLGRHAIGTPTIICGDSMQPALHDGQWFLRQELFSWQAIHRGDIVTFHDEGGDSVKRVIGLPGDTIQMRLGFVSVNGVRIEESYLPATMFTPASTAGQVLTAREDEYVVLGDNRIASFDSRDYGPIKRSRINGRIKLPNEPKRQ